jgi:hypothetical protein
MGIRADMAAALPDLFAALGEEAVFNPSGGDPVGCRVLIDFEVDLQPDGFSTTAWQRSTVMEALLSEISKEPDRGDAFLLEGINYTVKRVIFNDGLPGKVAVTP